MEREAREQTDIPRYLTDEKGERVGVILAENPRPDGTRRLRGRPGWRIRVGDYRVIYEIDDGRRVVAILKVAYRRESYR